MDVIFSAFVIALCLKILCVENSMIPYTYADKMVSEKDDSESQQGNQYEKPTGVMTLRDLQKTTTTLRYEGAEESVRFRYLLPKKETKDKPCSVMGASRNQNLATQSLLRKYRYDANGVLIPSSVKYYLKIPQGYGAAPLLIPLNGKAFSPLGGFVRYYKEVPPISPSL